MLLRARPRARVGWSSAWASTRRLMATSQRPAGHGWEAIESKWQAHWAQNAHARQRSRGDKTRPPYYCLAMFPYPSGQLHMGHVRVYTISDCLARLKRMQGYDVLHPMGWDAFGLPAENAAIERGIGPREWTVRNIAQAKAQLQSLGIDFHWDREVTTCNEDYYKWTQWLFLQFFEKGLAYQKEALVNWDPIDNTVLANEQVDAEGRSWRSGAVVEQRSLNQWFIRITEYADRLLDDLEKLEKWPDAVKRMQAAWIGRSKGSRVDFQYNTNRGKEHLITLPVFTTRVDTICGVSYVAIAPESSLVDELRSEMPADQRAKVDLYVRHVQNLTEEQRNEGDTTSGVFTGLYTTNPLTNEQVPIYLAEYVLAQYGTGVVMGVPAHDTRDHAFAMHHRLPIRRVIAPLEQAQDDECFTAHGVLVESMEFTGMTSYAAQKAINDRLKHNGQGGSFAQYRLRDWLVSRQRYWGTPVPVVHCESCGPVGVPTSDLPVELPPLGEGLAQDLRGGDGQSPLARMQQWRNTTCPQCHGPAQRDTDTLDTFVDSSWYYLRYCDAQNNQEPFSHASMKQWMKHNGVDLYVGGIEHAILHLLYSRFVTKFLYDQQLVTTDEPFAQLLAQGMVLGRTYKASGSMRYLKPDEYYVDDEGTVRETATKEPVITVWEKMSKSKYNGADPEHIRRQHGADVTRLVVLFKAPPSHELEWDEADLAGQSRWISRVWSLLDNAASAMKSEDSSAGPLTDAQCDELRLQLHGTIKRVTDALEHHQSFNVAIAELMKLSNFLGDKKAWNASGLYREALEALVKMLAPLAPHNASEMYEYLQQAGMVETAIDNGKVDVHNTTWPQYDPQLLAGAQVKIVLQVQGKVRDTIMVPADMQGNKDHVLEQALASSNVQRHVNGKAIRKAILIPPKKQGLHGVLNIVAA